MAPSFGRGRNRNFSTATPSGLSGVCPQYGALVLNFGFPSAASSACRSICLSIQFGTFLSAMKVGSLGQALSFCLRIVAKTVRGSAPATPAAAATWGKWQRK